MIKICSCRHMQLLVVFVSEEQLIPVGEAEKKEVI